MQFHVIRQFDRAIWQNTLSSYKCIASCIVTKLKVEI